MVIAMGPKSKDLRSNGKQSAFKWSCRRLNGNPRKTECEDSEAEPKEHMSDQGVSRTNNGMRDQFSVSGQNGAPPAGPYAIVSESKKCRAANQQQKQNSDDPAQADLIGFVPEKAGLAYIGSEGGPTAVIFDGLTDLATGFKETVSPSILIEADGAGITTHDAFAQNSTGQQGKLLLFQRNEMPLADFGYRTNIFQRNAAGEPLHAQVFSKITHWRTTTL
jgi:hypothetical protein